MKMIVRKAVAFSVVALGFTLCGEANADYITDVYGTGTPLSSWEYSSLVGAGRGNSTTYQPVRQDYSTATFRGFVAPNDQGRWDTVGAGPALFDEDTIRVFRTIVTSDRDQTIPLQLIGDDGHTVYVDGQLVGSGPIGVNVNFDLILAANVSVQLEVAGYNGPGPWALELSRRDNGLRIDSTTGVSLNAVPEPASLAMMGVGVLGVVSYSRQRSRRTGRCRCV